MNRCSIARDVQRQLDRHSNRAAMSSRPTRWVPILLLMALAAATIVAVPSVRQAVLRTAGWALVIDEPVAPADIIVVSLDSGGAGALEAADLVRCGFYRPSEWRRPRVHPPGAPLRRCERKANSPTAVTRRDGCHANLQNRRWNRR
jgi:hypothetical protein